MVLIDAAGDDSVIRDLSIDDHGGDVAVLQRILVKRGYKQLEPQVDGIFGRATEASVVHFQWSHGLNVDGVVGARTRVALGLQAKPPSGDDGYPILSEIDGLELGLSEPLTEHADIVDPDGDDPA